VILSFFVLRNKRREEELDEELDGEDNNKQEACSNSEDITESTSNEETDNIAVDTGKFAYDMTRLVPRLYVYVGLPSWPENEAG